MIAALILGTYAVVVALLAPALLNRFWPSDRAPRLTQKLRERSDAFALVVAIAFVIVAQCTLPQLADTH